MDKFFYGVFLIVSSIIGGIAGYGVILNLLLYPNDPKRHLARLLVKAGYVITSGVLLFAIISQGSTPTTWKSWAYLVGLCITGVGLGMMTMFDVEEKVVTDVPRSNKSDIVRLDDLERLAREHGFRLTAEEARNNDIEERARVAMHRADEAEAREGSESASQE